MASRHGRSRSFILPPAVLESTKTKLKHVVIDERKSQNNVLMEKLRMRSELKAKAANVAKASSTSHEHVSVARSRSASNTDYRELAQEIRNLRAHKKKLDEQHTEELMNNPTEAKTKQSSSEIVLNIAKARIRARQRMLRAQKMAGRSTEDDDSKTFALKNTLSSELSRTSAALQSNRRASVAAMSKAKRKRQDSVEWHNLSKQVQSHEQRSLKRTGVFEYTPALGDLPSDDEGKDDVGEQLISQDRINRVLNNIHHRTPSLQDAIDDAKERAILRLQLREQFPINNDLK